MRSYLSNLIKIRTHKISLYLTNKNIQFEKDLFVRFITNGSYLHYDAYNIYVLKNKDLFKAVYVNLIYDPEIVNNLKDYNISLIGTSLRDIETDGARIYNICPKLNMDKHTSFQDIYSSIIVSYCRIGPMIELDDIYRLVIITNKI